MILLEAQATEPLACPGEDVQIQRFHPLGGKGFPPNLVTPVALPGLQKLVTLKCLWPSISLARFHGKFRVLVPWIHCFLDRKSVV